MIYNQPVTQPIFDPLTAIIIKQEQPKPEPKLYTVVEGDVLEKVATANQTTVQRIYDKNLDLQDPDRIEVGQKLVIPFPEEELATRPLPAQNTPTAPQNSSQRASFSSSGNTYAKGYCTWWAKQMRPDLPNRMGNASNWVNSASKAGFSISKTPRVGAIGQQGNHVVYITAVSGNMVTTSEMNYVGLGVVSSRTVPASTFTYIY